MNGCMVVGPARSNIAYQNKLHLYINVKKSRDCVCVSVRTACVGGCREDSLEVCVNAPIHLLILGKCYVVNASSL